MSRRTTEQHYTPMESPPDDFCDWWNPTGIEEPSGASIGGHPDAERTWARKDPGRWSRRSFGINARMAWQCVPYRQEYLRWVDAGRPKREPFVSRAATLERQHQFYKELQATLAQIGKPMPTEDKQPLPKGVVDLKGEDDEAIEFD